MKKELIYRLVRITIVLVFLFVFSSVRADVKAKYDAAHEYINSMPSFVVTELDSNTSKEYGLRQEHIIELKNVTSKKQDVSFVIQNANSEFPYGYLNYTVLKDGKVVKTGVVTDNTLFKTNLSGNETSIYEIVFTMDMEDIYYLGGLSMSCELVFV